MLDYQTRFVEHLIQSGALKIGRFTLKSGRVSPYFINAASLMTDGKGCWATTAAFTCVANDLKIFSEDQNSVYIHGPAYKGISLAALLAHHLYYVRGFSARWGYDRKEEKTRGDLSESKFVGDIKDNDKVLIIDDVLTTGLTKVDQWIALQQHRKDLSLLSVLVAVDRQEQTPSDIRLMEKAGIKIHSIVTISQVFNHLIAESTITDEVYQSFLQYFEKYGVAN